MLNRIVLIFLYFCLSKEKRKSSEGKNKKKAKSREGSKP